MKNITKLPDTELEIMKVIWASAPPVTTNTIMEHLGHERKWKAPTAISLLLRLVERGFLSTEKKGKERIYYPLVGRDEYLRFETSNFMKLLHDNSMASFVGAFYGSKELSITEVEELKELIERGDAAK